MKSSQIVIESIEIDPACYTETKVKFFGRVKRSIPIYTATFFVIFLGFSLLAFAIRGEVKLGDLVLAGLVTFSPLFLTLALDPVLRTGHLTEIKFPKNKFETLSEIDGKTQRGLVKAINKDRDLLDALIFHGEMSSKIEDGLEFSKVSDIYSLKNKKNELETAISEKIDFMLKLISLKESKSNPHEIEELLEKGDFYLQKL